MNPLEELVESRVRTEWLFHDVAHLDWTLPRRRIVNLPLWELGHVAWFQEYWLLRRHDRRASIHPRGDELYDSARIHHAQRWELDLPGRDAVAAYMNGVLAAVRDRIETNARASATTDAERAEEAYFLRLATYHEDMHGEAFFYTRQTAGWPAPRVVAIAPEVALDSGPCPGDVDVPGGTFRLGGSRAEPFVFDNEMWAHARHVEPFRIARAPVTQAEFAAFVDAGGYEREEWWSEAGRRWRGKVGARLPLHWRRDSDGSYWRVHFDTPVPLEAHRPMLHVSWHEAEAFCAFAGRRLPTELEWEIAAAGEPDEHGDLAPTKRRFPWGETPPTPAHAHLAHDARGAPDRACDVGAFPRGDSAFGCRQMIGNVWEWTTDDFLPYPGFERGPYAEYSEPWFGDHKVLRGGAFTTRPRLLRNTWRNFYTPDRRDVMAGFRTCALRS